MNESENYLDQLLNAVDGRSDLNDSDPVNPEEIESKEQMPQKSTRETIDIPDSNDLFMDQFEQELRKDKASGAGHPRLPPEKVWRRCCADHPAGFVAEELYINLIYN